jgi:hypothetical protein
MQNNRLNAVSTRRDMLRKLGAGFGSLGLVAAVADAGALVATTGTTHFTPRAKRVIQLFMPGGPSAIDTFDYKPALEKHAGQRPAEVALKTLRNTKGGLLKSPFKFEQYGESGKWVSEIFSKTAQCVDDICFLHGMHTDIPEHAGGILMMNTGHVQPVRPSMGSWLMYGLGSENNDLPGFICLGDGKPRGGQANWSSSFLPSTYSGCHVEVGNRPTDVMSNLRNQVLLNSQQREQLELISKINRLHLKRREQDRQLEAGIASMELAFRMQSAVPEAFDTSGESKQTLELYGDKRFGKGCLLARRLVERGVRMVQVFGGNDIAWDTHAKIADHRQRAEQVDQGMAALLIDLKQRGMLSDTLVIWGGEFGRAPTAEGTVGRDHNHYGFTVWMAGGGVKSGFTFGATDQFGCRAVRNRMHVHDLHATILHLMGLDHEQLTYRHSGRDFRLTDVHGTVAKEILA